MLNKYILLFSLFLFPITAFALTAKDGDVFSRGVVETITIPNNVSITLSKATIRGNIVCEGNATITLVDTSKVYGWDFPAGIQIGGKGSTLTIKGDGYLYVIGDVGIGMGAMGADAVGGDIVIEGGTIIADADASDGSWNVGIGTFKSDAKLSMGSISIKGGSVTTRGSRWEDLSTPEEQCVGFGKNLDDDNDEVGPIVIYDDIDMLDVYGSSDNLTFVHDETNVIPRSDVEKYFYTAEKIDILGFRHTIYYSRKKDRFVTVSNYVEHGSIEASVSTAKAGDLVSLTSIPDKGYSVFWRVYDENGRIVEVADDSFIMPPSNVTVNAAFVLNSSSIKFLKMGEKVLAKDGFVLVDSTRRLVTIADGAHVTLATFATSDLSGGIFCEGDATITLIGNNVINTWDSAGIHIGGPGTTLTIRGEGSLDIEANHNGNAGIGLSYVSSGESLAGGDIVIEGGDITIVGGRGTFGGGAGIGTGVVRAGGSASIGSITIKGGSLKVDGGIGEDYLVASGVGKGSILGDDEVTVGPIVIYHGVKKVDVSSFSENVMYRFANGDKMINPNEYFSIQTENSRQVIRSLYAVHVVENIPHGIVTSSVASSTGKVAVGETVSLSIKPDFDYNLNTLSVTDDAGKEIKLVNNSFVMPVGNVTVNASFAPKYPTLTFDESRLNVTIDGQYEGKDTLKIAEPILVYNVDYQRNFTTDGYSTIVLPFNVYTDKLIGIDSVLSFAGIVMRNGKKAVGMKVVWERSRAAVELKANTPYMLKMNAATLGVNGPVTLQPTGRAVTEVDGWEFRGTYNYTAWPAGDGGLCRVYGFAGGSNDDVRVGDFVKFAAGSWIRPLRAYLINTNVSCGSGALPKANARPVMASLDDELPDQMDVVVIGDDDENENGNTTVIGRFNIRTGDFKMLRNYDLKGRKIQGKMNANGAYYGKKVLNK